MSNLGDLIRTLEIDRTVDWPALVDRRIGYTSVHAGKIPMRIGRLLDQFLPNSGKGKTATLLPPRTGHLGNWEAIVMGCAGALDFNQAICLNNFGYPLIYCFTETEAQNAHDASASGRGDWVYLPGSQVARGVRRQLPLYTWDGKLFAARGRELPLFCPFVQTQDDEAGQGLVSLVEYHMRRMHRIEGFSFRLEPQVILDNEEQARWILCVLIEEAARNTNSRRALSDIVNRAVFADGRVAKCNLEREGVGFRLLDQRFDSADALAAQMLNVCRAVTQPREFFDEIGSLPLVLPIISNLVAGALSAIFATHYPDCDPARRKALTQPFNLHFHWGARDMAGYPPRHNGYFCERSTTRSLRRMFSTLTGRLDFISPVCVLLLPASIFMLCPSSSQPRDIDAVQSLLGEVIPLGDDISKIERVTAAWHARNAGSLSQYFLGRFRPRSGVPLAGESGVPVVGRPVIPGAFRDTTVQQACAVVGALVAAVTVQ